MRGRRIRGLAAAPAWLALTAGIAVHAAPAPPLNAAPKPGPTARSQESRPDLAVSLRSTTPNRPRNEVIITVTVRNAGDAASPRTSCQVFLRNAHPPRQTVKQVKKGVRALEPNDQYAFSFRVRLALGTYEVEAVADRAGKIDEPDKANNSARLTLAGR